MSDDPKREEAPPEKTAEFLGAVAQGLIIGGLVFLALTELASLASDAQLFRYQGF